MTDDSIARQMAEGHEMIDRTTLRYDLKRQEEILDAGTKYDEGKLRYDLIPEDFLEEMARVYTIGASKYGDNNWRKGLKFSRMKASMLRHLIAFYKGEDHDPENGQHSLAAVAFYCAAIIYFQKAGRDDLDDRGSRQ